MLYSKRRKNLGGGRKKRSNRKSNRSNIFSMKGGAVSELEPVDILAKFNEFVDTHKNDLMFVKTIRDIRNALSDFLKETYGVDEFGRYMPGTIEVEQNKELMNTMTEILKNVRINNQLRQQKHYTVIKIDKNNVFERLPAQHFIRKQGSSFYGNEIPVIIEKIESVYPNQMTEADKQENEYVMGKIGLVTLDSNKEPDMIKLPIENSTEYILRNIDKYNHDEYSIITMI
jgi:hypothetical protein